MKIEEFFDGYCITHKGEDYKFAGKTQTVINQVSERVKVLMLQDMEELKTELLRQNHLI